MSYNGGWDVEKRQKSIRRKEQSQDQIKLLKKAASSSILTFKEYGFENLVLEGVFFFCKFSNVF